MTDLHKPDNTTDTDVEYKNYIDEGFQNVERTAWSFAPHPAFPTPDMTIDLNPGAIWNSGTLTEKVAQTTTIFTAPVTNPRIDRVVVDEGTGTYSIVAGAEAASPVAPAIPAGKFPVCQISFLTTSTSIGYVGTSTVAAITDERIPFAVTSAAGIDQTARDMAVAALVEANAAGIAGSKGPLVLVDPFTSDTLDTSTNATYDAGGDFYSNVATATATQSNATGPNVDNINVGQFLAQSFQVSTTDDITQLRFSTINANVGTVDIRLETDSAGSPSGTLVAAGAEETGVSVNSIGDIIATLTTAFTPATSTTYWMVMRNAGGLYANVWKCDNTTSQYANGTRDANGTQAGDYWFGVFQLPVPANMTLAEGSGVLITADPSDLSAYFRINPIDAVTMGTDVVGKLSIDDGTSKATGSWTQVGNFDSDELWRLDADVSAQTGSTCFFEITTANNKELQLNACGGILPIA